jgi:hypothetical protein
MSIQPKRLELSLTFIDRLGLKRMLAEVINGYINGINQDRMIIADDILDYKITEYFNEKSMRIEEIRGQKCIIIKSKV